MVTLREIQSTASMALGLASAVTLAITGLQRNEGKIAGIAGIAGTLSIVSFIRAEKDNEKQKTQEKLDQTQKLLNELETELNETSGELTETKGLYQEAVRRLNAFKDENGQFVDIAELNRYISVLEADLKGIRGHFEQVSIDLATAKGESASLTIELERANGRIQQYASQFDDLNRTLEESERQNMEFKARFNSADELARLRASEETRELEKKLESLRQEYNKLVSDYQNAATLYNSLKADHVAKVKEFQTEFAELNEAVSTGIPSAFDAMLTERDRELLRLSGMVSELEKPQLFEAHGEYTRANTLINTLWQSEDRVCLDANEIVPLDNGTGFEVYLSLRDRKARGQAFIDTLDSQGNQLAIVCSCIKDLKFEYDRVNPHRIKTTMVYRKPQKIDSKSSIDKLWIPREQFDSKLMRLLKKPMTRVMGASGEGKGIFVNLMLAVETNSLSPAYVRLHDPMDGSEKDFWNVPKVSKGKAATKKAVDHFGKEFNDRLENQVSEPKTLDVFDELDIVAEGEPSINKTMLNAAKGMRHCGMRAVIIGQSPSVGKKGLEWADMDNFNAVYFGSAIVTAIEKTPALEHQSAKLKETYQKLSDYCQKQNDEHGLDSFEDWNAYRFGLLVTQGKPYFFELPNADSIACNWSNLSKSPETQEPSNAALKGKASDTSACSHDSYRVTKKAKNSEGIPIKEYRKCKTCGSNFTVNL